MPLVQLGWIRTSSARSEGRTTGKYEISCCFGGGRRRRHTGRSTSEEFSLLRCIDVVVVRYLHNHYDPDSDWLATVTAAAASATENCDWKVGRPVSYNYERISPFRKVIPVFKQKKTREFTCVRAPEVTYHSIAVGLIWNWKVKTSHHISFFLLPPPLPCRCLIVAHDQLSNFGGPTWVSPKVTAQFSSVVPGGESRRVKLVHQMVHSSSSFALQGNGSSSPPKWINSQEQKLCILVMWWK